MSKTQQNLTVVTRDEQFPVRLEEQDVAIVKAMLNRGDKQHDIAAFFGVNGGRIAEIASGQKWEEVPAAHSTSLPAAGPLYVSHNLVSLLNLAERKMGTPKLRRLLQTYLDEMNAEATDES